MIYITQNIVEEYIVEPCTINCTSISKEHSCKKCVELKKLFKINHFYVNKNHWKNYCDITVIWFLRYSMANFAILLEKDF